MRFAAAWPAALAAGALLSCAAAAQSPAPARPFHAGDPAQWGRAIHVTEPAYPPQALAEGRTGHVEVRGRVSPAGLLEQITYSPGEPRAAAFIDSIRRVIRSWRFEAPLGRDCQPSEERVANRVSFAIENGRPKITVERSAPQHGWRWLRRLSPLRGEQPRLAEAMRREDAPPVVYVRLQVGPVGDVLSVEPRMYARRSTAAREIEHEVIRVLAQWRFPAAAPGEGASRVVCQPVRFS